MKKIISLITCFAFLISLSRGTLGVAVDQNGEQVSEIPFTTTIERVSDFEFETTDNEINSVKPIAMAKFWLENNTRDGFSLSLKTTNGLVLSPTATSLDGEDGETAMDYDIKVHYSGTKNQTNFDYITDVGDLDAETYTEIISLSAANDTAGKKTQLSNCIVSIDLEDAHDDQLKMAGNYEDAITLKYDDI